MGARNLVRFTTDDVRTLIGREPTDQEYRNLVKTLEFSEMAEVFTDVVNTVCDAGLDVLKDEE